MPVDQIVRQNSNCRFLCSLKHLLLFYFQEFRFPVALNVCVLIPRSSQGLHFCGQYLHRVHHVSHGNYSLPNLLLQPIDTVSHMSRAILYDLGLILQLSYSYPAKLDVFFLKLADSQLEGFDPVAEVVWGYAAGRQRVDHGVEVDTPMIVGSCARCDESAVVIHNMRDRE